MSVGAEGFAEGSFGMEEMYALRHFLCHAVDLCACVFSFPKEFSNEGEMHGLVLGTVVKI